MYVWSGMTILDCTSIFDQHHIKMAHSIPFSSVFHEIHYQLNQTRLKWPIIYTYNTFITDISKYSPGKLWHFSTDTNMNWLYKTCIELMPLCDKSSLAYLAKLFAYRWWLYEQWFGLLTFEHWQIIQLMMHIMCACSMCLAFIASYLSSCIELRWWL